MSPFEMGKRSRCAIALITSYCTTLESGENRQRRWTFKKIGKVERTGLSFPVSSSSKQGADVAGRANDGDHFNYVHVRSVDDQVVAHGPEEH
jgi:hypothetical protein